MPDGYGLLVFLSLHRSIISMYNVTKLANLTRQKVWESTNFKIRILHNFLKLLFTT